MTLAATFLGGAKSRLLPPSVPFRFFAAAALFHVAMWLVLLVASRDALGFRGALGPALAAVHLLTLGVLTATAIGASAQLLPVATRRALASVFIVKLVFWLTVPGMIILIAGMYQALTAVMILGAAATTAGLLVFTWLLADNLRRAGDMPVVAAYGWVALASLAALVALGLTLATDYQVPILGDHQAVALAHLILGGFGFMGFLALGFSHVLVPMFALASAPAKRPSLAVFATATAALVLATAGALASNRLILIAAALIGLIAAGGHVWLMLAVLKAGMRKRLGLSFVLVRGAWAMLPAALLVGLAELLGLAGDNGATLFGFLLLFGWLLTFLFAILQRIMPFLASMFVGAPAGGGPAIVSALAGATPLKVHAACHAAAIAALTIAIAIDNAVLARMAAVVGLVGALAFAWFTADVIRRVFPAARD